MQQHHDRDRRAAFRQYKAAGEIDGATPGMLCRSGPRRCDGLPCRQNESRPVAQSEKDTVLPSARSVQPKALVQPPACALRREPVVPSNLRQRSVSPSEGAMSTKARVGEPVPHQMWQFAPHVGVGESREKKRGASRCRPAIPMTHAELDTSLFKPTGFEGGEGVSQWRHRSSHGRLLATTRRGSHQKAAALLPF